MLAPVSRCQSPISTDSPNAVSVETPRRQPCRFTAAQVGADRAGGVGLVAEHRLGPGPRAAGRAGDAQLGHQRLEHR